MESKLRTTHNSHWRIVSFNQPTLWTRNEDEVWMFNPRRRYILNANQLENLQPYIETMSDLHTSADYKPLRMGARLPSSTVLVERYRERGIGDLLFMTGPLAYFHHVTTGDVNVHFYALSDRGPVLNGNPTLPLPNRVPLYGPVHYDDLRYYDYHWFVDTVTEYNEEPDQLNVYDALFKQLGFDPATIEPQFKRPYTYPNEGDLSNLDQFMYFTFMQRKIDLRRTGYYVVAPFSRGSLRAAPYGVMLDVIRELANRRPVVVMGDLTSRMPATDMEAGEFMQHLQSMSSRGGVINAIGATPHIRVAMAVLSKAKVLVTLDSGLLYVAQGMRIPAVSIWGPVDPRARIGYDAEYMKLAVWNKAACRNAPCFAYDWFPAAKCPAGAAQTVCQPLLMVGADEIIERVFAVEERDVVIPPIPVGGAHART